MKTIKGPAIFLAQFAGDAAPFNSLPAIAQWASSSRLNPMGALGPYRDHPVVIEARALIQQYHAAADSNLSRLLAM